MEALKTFGISTCIVLIISSLFSMILPNISQKNAVKILISAFILSGMLYSFTEFINKNDISFGAVFSDATLDADDKEITYPDKIWGELEERAVTALYPMISDKRKKYNIKQFGVDVLLDSKKDGAQIKCVNITVDTQHINSIDVILKEIEDELGLNVNLNVLNLEGN